MATITITNLTNTEIYLRDLGTTIGKAGVIDSSLGRLDTLTVTRPMEDVKEWTGLSTEIAAGKLSMVITPSADEASSHLTVVSCSTAPITLYVAADGSDSNTGTATAPLKTIQAALDRLPKRIKHAVTVKVGEGEFAGAWVEGFTVERNSNPSEPSYLAVTGTMGAPTLTSGLTSGTATSGTGGSGGTHGTLTLTGAGWTVNELEGKIVYIVGGTGSGQDRVIVSNTADTLTIAGTWTAPNGTSSFEIKEQKTAITTSAAVGGTWLSNPARACAIGFRNNATTFIDYSDETLVVSDFKFTNSDYGVVCGNADGIPGVYRCAFNNTGLYGVYVFGGVFTHRCYFYGPSVSGLISGGTRLPAYAAFIRHCYFKGDGTNTGVSFYNATHVYVWDAKFYNTKTAALITTISGPCVFTGVNIDCNSIASSVAFSMTTSGHRQCKAYFNSSSVSNATTVVTCGDATLVDMDGAWSGSGNGTVINASKGARVRVATSMGLTGSTADINLDGATSTLSAMRAATPKHVKDANYFTVVYE